MVDRNRTEPGCAMLKIQVNVGSQVSFLSVAQFLGAGDAPCAMFVEEAINRFNASHPDQQAKLVKVLH